MERNSIDKSAMGKKKSIVNTKRMEIFNVNEIQYSNQLNQLNQFICEKVWAFFCFVCLFRIHTDCSVAQRRSLFDAYTRITHCPVQLLTSFIAEIYTHMEIDIHMRDVFCICEQSEALWILLYVLYAWKPIYRYDIRTNASGINL